MITTLTQAERVGAELHDNGTIIEDGMTIAELTTTSRR